MAAATSRRRQNRNEYAEAGQIPIDSIYSPVLKVTYRVDATRAGERTDFDQPRARRRDARPSITPRDAIASAGRTLTELFGLARELNVEAEGIEIGPAPVDAVLSSELSMPIEDLDLSVRSLQLPQARGHQHRVSELVALSETQLMNIRNFGQKSVDEVRDKLVALGLSLKDSVPGFDGAHFYGGYDDENRLIRASTRLLITGVTEQCLSPRRVPASEAAPRTSACCSRTSPRRCSRTRAIKTTETKAKRLRPLAERLVTFAKRGDLHARRRVLSVIGDKAVVHELFTEIAPLVADREGGYTRITKIGNRKGDNAPMAVIELVLEPVNPKPKRAKKAAKADAAPASPRLPPRRPRSRRLPADEAADAGAESPEEGAAAEAAAEDAVVDADKA